MKLDWNTLVDLSESNVVLRRRNSDATARVTIGLPTYRRPDLIRRALASIASQSFRDFVLVISDNAGRDGATSAAVEEFIDQLPEVVLVAQEENIGALNNFKFVLAAARTEYFMWISDDDEISPDYLEELVGLLDGDAGIVTAMGNWMDMTSPTEGSIRPQLRPEERSLARRLVKFVAGPADDTAFYGVHRTDCLRKTRFTRYLPPNAAVLTNFCYILLFDLLWMGRIQFGKSAEWICHNYTSKEYNRALARGVKDRARTLLRRLNVYLIYIARTLRRRPSLAPLIVAASVWGLSRDMLAAMFRLTKRAIGNTRALRGNG